MSYFSLVVRDLKSYNQKILEAKIKCELIVP